jgi:hypothetical protein
LPSVRIWIRAILPQILGLTTFLPSPLPCIFLLSHHHARIRNCSHPRYLDRLHRGDNLAIHTPSVQLTRGDTHRHCSATLTRPPRKTKELTAAVRTTAGKNISSHTRLSSSRSWVGGNYQEPEVLRSLWGFKWTRVKFTIARKSSLSTFPVCRKVVNFLPNGHCR